MGFLLDALLKAAGQSLGVLYSNALHKCLLLYSKSNVLKGFHSPNVSPLTPFGSHLVVSILLANASTYCGCSRL
jgi:hypothetical protein